MERKLLISPLSTLSCLTNAQPLNSIWIKKREKNKQINKQTRLISASHVYQASHPRRPPAGSWQRRSDGCCETWLSYWSRLAWQQLVGSKGGTQRRSQGCEVWEWASTNVSQWVIPPLDLSRIFLGGWGRRGRKRAQQRPYLHLCSWSIFV